MSGAKDKEKKKHHFERVYSTGLTWVASEQHDYKLQSIKETLGLKAFVGETPLGSASALDHIIWDEMIQKDTDDTDTTLRWCDCLTLWTEDLEFNLLLFGSNNVAMKVRCAYSPAPDKSMCKEHIEYWNTILFHEKISFLPKDANNSETAKNLLSEMVVCNRYIKSSGGEVSNEQVFFQRTHMLARDPFRKLLQTIPLPTKFLCDDGATVGFTEDCVMASESLYKLILSRYASVAGCGSAMRRNLLTLSSLLVDKNIKVALVTGEPGTGKENLCKAIYFGNKLAKPEMDEDEALFLETTAVEIQSEMAGSAIETSLHMRNLSLEATSEMLGSKTPSEILRRKLNAGLRSGQTIHSPVIFIDELNKAKPEFLGAMLRPLEQGERELKTVGDPKYILAASQHIDELAQKPPQDFWTRISHQLRVVHPLSRVSEEDGEVFLRSFFYSQWWIFVEEMIRSSGSAQSKILLITFLGKIENDQFRPSPLCQRVEDEFLNTLVPLVSRDTLSVRGARSILSQVFARLSWFVRFQKPERALLISEKPDGQLPRDTANQVAQLVNSAVQDVMAILNAARSTPAGMEEKSPRK